MFRTNQGFTLKQADHFLSCDWGTTSFRLRLASLPDGEVLHELIEQAGVQTINESLPQNLVGEELADARAAAFREFLQRKIKELGAPIALQSKPLPIVISGMASSTVGWRDVPYARTPFPLDGASVQHETLSLEIEGQEFPLYLLSGLRTKTDIMRGEETQMLGLYASKMFAEVFEAGTVLLPGTHSKHVRARDGVIEDFQTHMTGELFAVLSRHSLLSASVAFDDEVTPENDSRLHEAFIEGLEAAQKSGLSRSLFQVRTRAVLQGIDPVKNRWFLSGLLIGAEFRDLLSDPSGSSILIAAPSHFSNLYALGLKTLDAELDVHVVPSELMEKAAVLGQAAWMRTKG